MAAGFKPAPPAGQLGSIVVDPYGNAPLTAVVNLDSHVISDVKVTVHGKGEKVCLLLIKWARITENLRWRTNFWSLSEVRQQSDGRMERKR